MESLEVARVRAVLDRLAREKEIAQNFFNRMADTLEDVEKRRWFRRMGQDEKDQRKILVKHRKELCHDGAGLEGVLPPSNAHQTLASVTKDCGLGFVELLRLAARAAEDSRVFADRASDMVGDRSCRIFLKILSEEGRSHRDELLAELRLEERVAAAEIEAA